jgi:DNA-binding response OmpR family regulator
MKNSARILVIEDELSMRTVLQDTLSRQGYRVLVAEDGEIGLKKAIEEKPDLILLDLMMPKLDGFSLCAELRRLSKSMPILILTARGKIEDRVHGLDVGADDFLVKPFSRDELLARVRALLRRARRDADEQKQTLELGDVLIDFLKTQAWKNGVEIHLAPKEFEMLRLMSLNPGETISREKFLDVVWGYTAFPSTRTVDKHVASLRNKIEVDAENPQWIQTVHAVGYRLSLTEAD